MTQLTEFTITDKATGHVTIIHTNDERVLINHISNGYYGQIQKILRHRVSVMVKYPDQEERKFSYM